MTVQRFIHRPNSDTDRLHLRHASATDPVVDRGVAAPLADALVSRIRNSARADAERLADLLPTLAERHAGLVVDTAGFGNQAATVAAAAADLVLVPVSPGEADVMEAGLSPMSLGWRAARAGRPGARSRQPGSPQHDSG